ncbi:AMP-dependent synthetase [Mycobacterium vulneris]|uniref:AMP-dependent synthetase n=1 Tax=Mycolicibacterium vulneris TaxID=547163 RepID=A0A1X2LDJ0_9MYCO|nr:AMP-binding protein [Mycolicibacterium vulneris]OSC31573.1 AMP-dependent synthetase [Mycolicibacterium vulneris]
MDPTAGRAAYRAARDILVQHRDDYDRAAAAFRWPALGERFNWALDWFDPLAVGNPRCALRIIGEDGSDDFYSYAEMASRSDRLATSLAAGGVMAGDRVMVMLGNQVELWDSMLALMKLGAVILPTTTALGPDDVADRVTRGAVRHVITSADQVVKFAAIPGDFGRIAIGDAPAAWRTYGLADAAGPRSALATATRAKDPMLIYFTSGTTSQPKLVEHTHQSYSIGHMSTMYLLGLRPGDVHLNISASGWAKHAWSSLFAPWIAESTVLVYKYARFDASRFLTMLRQADVSSLCAPPTVWRMLIQATLGTKPAMLRELLSAGEPLNAEVIAHVHKHWGLTVRDGFGQTETTALIGNTPGSLVKPGSMGRPLPGVDIELVDPLTGQPASEGEICLRLHPRPVNLMAGYLGDEGSNGVNSGDGYYHTGDVAIRDTDGYFTYVGRTDDVFKSSDYKISPFELESVLLEHPAVAEAAVVPAPDPIRLAVPKAYISLAAGWAPDKATANEIFVHAHRKLAPYQRIQRIEFIELPKTTSGKIRRKDLRARENDTESSDARQEYRAR